MDICINFNDWEKKSCFIITRFNLKLFSKDKKNRVTLTDQWLKERFELFDTYCYPSVKGQILQNFYWICLFADDTPEFYKQKIFAKRSEYDSFLPVFLDEEKTHNYNKYINNIIESLKDDSKRLITIRLDNDDSIHKDYTRRLEELYGSQSEKEVCYSFKYGLQYYTKKNLAVRIPYPTNHFLCLINKEYNKTEIKNILEYNHACPDSFPFIFKCLNDKEPMWIEVVHGRNVDNDCKMTLDQKVMCTPNLLISNFNVFKTLSPLQSRMGIFTYLIPSFIKQFVHRLRTKVKL